MDKQSNSSSNIEHYWPTLNRYAPFDQRSTHNCKLWHLEHLCQSNPIGLVSKYSLTQSVSEHRVTLAVSNFD